MIARLVPLLVLLAAACSGSLLPTTMPTATTTTADCWVAARGTYTLVIPGTGPTERELQGVAQVVAARLAAADLADADARPEPPDRIVVRVGPTERMDDIRSLITSPGVVDFAPVPSGRFVEDGDRLNPSWTPLFGREGIAQAKPEVDQFAQPTIVLTLTPEAARTLDEWAEANVGTQLAIAVDGIVVLAPMVQSGSFGGQMQLTGPDDQGRGRLLALLSQPQLPGELVEVSFSEQTPPPGCLATSTP